MIKKFFHNRVVLNTLILFLFTLSVELLVRYHTHAPFSDWGTLRITISSLLIATSWSYITHFFPKLIARILNIIYVLFVGIYCFAQFGLYNFLGFFMGIGNTEQGTKVVSYIVDFINALSPVHYTILIPTIITLLYYLFIDRIIYKNKKRNNEMTLLQKGYIEVVTFILILSLAGIYYTTIKNKNMQNELQTESNYSLWRLPENSNLTVNNFGVLIYGFADIKSVILKTEADDITDDFVPDSDNDFEEGSVPLDYSRVIDDTAWNMLIDNTSNSTRKTLNNYFINREITSKNDMTGIFEGKNLIIVMLESVNEISILNQEDFPTLYKLYNEGISFRNNFSPRNNCSTGNNEFTSLTSLFTINNTCTANWYKNNTYFEAAFNVFKNAGYATTSYHNYTEKYYYRNKIHTNLGVDKFYGVQALGIDWTNDYGQWPSDVELMEQAQQYYMNEDKFMVYMATVTPHQTYHISSKYGDLYMDEWKDKGYNKKLRRYLSKIKVLDQALETLLKQLEEAGKLDDTVIALFADHFPYGLNDSDINPYLKDNGAAYTVNRNSTKNKNVDRTPMVIYNSQIEPTQVYDYTTIIDLLPTLLNMFNVEYDPRLYLGTDIFAESHKSRAVFADGSWQDEFGFYYAPSSKMTYTDTEFKYTNEELKAINVEISTRQKMSTSAIKNNYFKYLGEGLAKYKKEIELQNQITTTTVANNITNESEE